MPETEQQETPQEKPAEKPDGEDGAAQRKALDLSELKEMNIQALTAMARELGVEGAAGMKKHDLIFKILQSQTEKSGLLFAEGVLETPARRLRLPARAGVELPARARRHLRLAVADPQVRPAHRRHRLRPGAAAQGGRALLRAHQGRGHQLRAAGRWPRTRSSSTT